jgi:hypothetical protein
VISISARPSGWAVKLGKRVKDAALRLSQFFRA